ncbi:hypothetical protein QHH03_11530, partial [Aphanizomenon sp. 202]|nr:hypothetical protein [Aphanizomenon sp. 202]
SGFFVIWQKFKSHPCLVYVRGSGRLSQPGSEKTALDKVLSLQHFSFKSTTPKYLKDLWNKDYRILFCTKPLHKVLYQNRKGHKSIMPPTENYGKDILCMMVVIVFNSTTP